MAPQAYVQLQAHAGPPGSLTKTMSPQNSPRGSLAGWKPSAAWLPLAALCGALLTLAVVSLGGSNAGIRWKGEWRTLRAKRVWVGAAAGVARRVCMQGQNAC